ncbi:MAG: lytic transglycosylase domain-containing protein [Deltaproteobacteria bacterium]|nr:lytic transglycosylase domain-containing protein [Deltaproteobacteria bacterium]
MFAFKRAFYAAALAVIGLSAPESFAAPIYVYKERDGSIRFTSKPPPPGIQAKVFTGSKANFSIYKVRQPLGRKRLFTNVYSDIISKAAADYSLDPALIKAVIHVESAFNARAVSPKGARGLMQLMPDTARMLGVKNSFVPSENIDGGARHLSRLIVKYSGNLKYALAAYNAGEEAVHRFNGIPPYSETRNYVRRVLDLHQRYRAVSVG